MYLCSNGSSVKVELGIGKLVARVYGQCLGVQVVGFAPFAGLEGIVALLFLLAKQLCFLQLNVFSEKYIKNKTILLEIGGS